MRRRLITALGLAVIGVPAILLGGIFYYLLMGTFLIGAAWEYVHMFRAVKFEPQMHLTVGGVALVTLARMFAPEFAMPVFGAAILAALTYHLIAYERGRDQAALDFCISIGGVVYIGWIGSYLFDLRNLPQGGWWFMLVMFCVWAGDSGAYSIGRAYGKHKMAPRLSPKKSWEGYVASVFTGIITGGFYVWVFQRFGSLTHDISIWQGAILGLLLGAFPTLGDLGESMIKRQSGLKDSSDIIPGHGGFFDRIDSWLWGSMIGFYFLVWFIL
ncbi:MAG TPA: phosphatidate cytidylyltransferase [Anaerolineales bacterium]|nr:phosphatidate cytidylyltransferase [Anaerolineales bacterium]HNO83620.1 phosphatidate cytidylyltransferase [Anaerolineales bacterium]HUM25999.1 phosphatidate cytidylyltransferase [Anaerolineales bacterium]